MGEGYRLLGDYRGGSDMRVDMYEQLIRVGSLVMWNREHSEDYQCMGVVIEHDTETFSHCDYRETFEFVVLWADNDRCVYDYDDLWREHIKVVKF